jgi:hypothetical protein
MGISARRLKPWTEIVCLRPTLQYMSKIPDTSEEIRRNVRSSDVILTASATTLTMDDVLTLRKLLPLGTYTTVITRQVLFDALDGSPFCQMTGDSLFPTNFCVFLRGDVNFAKEIILKWLRVLKKNHGANAENMYLVVSTKMYCMRIDRKSVV